MNGTEEISILDFPNICRTCLGKKDVKPMNEAFVEIFKQIFGNELDNEKYLPNNLCDKCSDKLKEFFVFTKICRTNFETLKTIFMDNCKTVTEEVQQLMINFEMGNESDENMKQSRVFGEVCVKSENSITVNNHSFTDQDLIIDLSEDNDKFVNHDDLTGVICKRCSKSFFNIQDLHNHEKLNLNCSQGILNFNQDPIMNPNKPPKAKRILNPATGENIIISEIRCTVCKRMFFSYKELGNHKRFNPDCRNENIVEQNFYINGLEKSVGRGESSFLPEHEWNENKDKDDFNCKECGKAFKNKWCYRRHVKTHSSERPYVCNICTKAFKQKAHLKDHEKIHTGEKPFQCFICQKKFRHLSTLGRHHHKHIEVT